MAGKNDKTTTITFHNVGGYMFNGIYRTLWVTKELLSDDIISGISGKSYMPDNKVIPFPGGGAYFILNMEEYKNKLKELDEKPNIPTRP